MTDSKKIEQIKKIIITAEQWCKDQDNKLTDGQICIAAMKDIRRIIKDASMRYL